MDNTKNVYYVPVFFESYGRIPVKIEDGVVTRKKLIEKAWERLKDISLYELDMSTDYLTDSEGVDEEGLIISGKFEVVSNSR